MDLKRILPLNALVLGAGLLAVAAGLSGIHPLLTIGPALRIVTGLALLGLLLWMVQIVVNRLLRRGDAHRDLSRHRQLAVAATLLFVVHATASGYLWTRGLWVLFVVAALSSFLARSQVRFHTRRAFLLQYGLHSLAGTAALSAGLWHGIVAIAFR